MYPKFDEIIRLKNDLLPCLQYSLEYISKMTDIEFIMEILSSLSEISLNLGMELQSTFDNWLNLLLDRTLEFAEMFIQVCLVDDI